MYPARARSKACSCTREKPTEPQSEYAIVARRIAAAKESLTCGSDPAGNDEEEEEEEEAEEDEASRLSASSIVSDACSTSSVTTVSAVISGSCSATVCLIVLCTDARVFVEGAERSTRTAASTIDDAMRQSETPSA